MSAEIEAAIWAFFAAAANTDVFMDNEAGLQHELGLWLRASLPGYGVRFEQPYTSLGLSGSFTKKEIDLVVVIPGDAGTVAIELKYPRRGAHPNQMFKFCEDLAFLEELCAGGLAGGIFVCLVDDPLFCSGPRTDGIYGYFRTGASLTGVITNPIRTEEGAVLIRGTYTVRWECCGVLRKFCIVTTSRDHIGSAGLEVVPSETRTVQVRSLPQRPRAASSPQKFSTRGSKYDPLRDHLRTRTEPSLTLSFKQIEEILGTALPMSARTHQAWWANQSSDRAPVQSHSWMDAGFLVDGFDFNAGWVRFRRGRCGS